MLPGMHLTPSFFDFTRSQGDLLFGKVMARDGLQLWPTHLTRAAAKRARAGIRALEAYLRRMILLLALTLEPTLKSSNQPTTPKDNTPALNPKWRFQIFTAEQDCPDFSALHDPWADPTDAAWTLPLPRGFQLPSAPLLARLAQLQALLQSPEDRALRLAFHLGRKRPGPLLAPDLWRTLIRSRHGTELSAIYAAMANAITALSRIRPPPLAPLPVRPPRIRAL